MQVDTVNHTQTKITNTDFNRNWPLLLLVPFIFNHVGQCACVPVIVCFILIIIAMLKKLLYHSIGITLWALTPYIYI